MNRIFITATAVLLSSVAASAATAAVITQNYTTVSTFATGPYRTVTQKFTLTFDPTSDATATLSNYSSDAGGSLSNTGSFRRYYINTGRGVANFADYFYAANGSSFTANNPGYNLNLYFDAQGGVTRSSLDYSDGKTYQSATSSVTTVVLAPIDNTPTAGAVPEPATWAMMLIGFGGIGFAMRRKTVTTRIRFA